MKMLHFLLRSVRSGVWSWWWGSFGGAWGAWSWDYLGGYLSLSVGRLGTREMDIGEGFFEVRCCILINLITQLIFCIYAEIYYIIITTNICFFLKIEICQYRWIEQTTHLQDIEEVNFFLKKQLWKIKNFYESQYQWDRCKCKY